MPVERRGERDQGGSVNGRWTREGRTAGNQTGASVRLTD